MAEEKALRDEIDKLKVYIEKNEDRHKGDIQKIIDIVRTYKTAIEEMRRSGTDSGYNSQVPSQIEGINSRLEAQEKQLIDTTKKLDSFLKAYEISGKVGLPDITDLRKPLSNREDTETQHLKEETKKGDGEKIGFKLFGKRKKS